MPLYIMYFNLKDEVDEEEFIEKLRAFAKSIKVEGLGSPKLYRHHGFGAHPRTFQMHTEFKDFGNWDGFHASIQNDSKLARLGQEWQNLVDMNTHYDEFVIEIPL
jgi:hypothetical protein